MFLTKRFVIKYFSCDEIDFTASANEAYERAKEKGEDLPSTHPIKLGLVLNYSVFQYEIQNNSNKACQMAKKVSGNYVIASFCLLLEIVLVEGGGESEHTVIHSL